MIQESHCVKIREYTTLHNTFKQKLTSTLNVKILVNPLSTLNVKMFYIKSNILH